MSPVARKLVGLPASPGYWACSRWACSGFASSLCKPRKDIFAKLCSSTDGQPSLLLFVIYFPRATSPTDPTHSVSSTSNVPTYRTALAITAICLLHALVTVIISVAFAIRQPSALHAWTNFLGILAAILASIQYFPQIYTTYRLRCVGSLSIPMMCIQTPGSLIWAASLAAREGAKGWSIWGVLLVTASLQGTLLVMAIYFEYFGPDSERKTVHQADQDAYTNGDGPDRSERYVSAQEPMHAERPTEETPLLASQ